MPKEYHNFIKAKNENDDIFLSNRKIRKSIPNFNFTSMESGINDYIINNYK